MKESYEQMEMKRLAAQRKKEKAQAIKDKERVRQQVRLGSVSSVLSDMSDIIIPVLSRPFFRHFPLFLTQIVSFIDIKDK